MDASGIGGILQIRVVSSTRRAENLRFRGLTFSFWKARASATFHAAEVKQKQPSSLCRALVFRLSLSLWNQPRYAAIWLSTTTQICLQSQNVLGSGLTS